MVHNSRTLGRENRAFNSSRIDNKVVADETHVISGESEAEARGGVYMMFISVRCTPEWSQKWVNDFMLRQAVKSLCAERQEWMNYGIKYC